MDDDDSKREQNILQLFHDKIIYTHVMSHRYLFKVTNNCHNPLLMKSFASLEKKFFVRDWQIILHLNVVKSV